MRPRPDVILLFCRKGTLGMGAASSLSVVPASPPSPSWGEWSRHTGHVTAEGLVGWSAQTPRGLVMC